MFEKKLYKLIGKRITYLRKKAGYSSQETFAYDADIPRALYGRYEQGSNLTINSLYRILKYHKITFKDFFAEGFENFWLSKIKLLLKTQKIGFILIQIWRKAVFDLHEK